MDIFTTVFGAILLAAVVGVILAVAGKKRPEAAPPNPGEDSDLAGADSEKLEEIVSSLLERRGIEVNNVIDATSDLVRIEAEDPTPMTGQRILVHCLPFPKDSEGSVERRHVSRLAEDLEGSRASKGFLFTTGLYTRDARLFGDELPIELFDRQDMVRMLHESAPVEVAPSSEVHS